MSILRVLIVSENVSMRMGGEASLPFYYAKLLSARGAEVWIACHERVRAEVMEQFPDWGERIVFVKDTWFQKFLFRHTGWLPYRISDLFVGQLVHFSTQRRLRVVARDLAKRGRIDIAFEPSPISPKGLSFLYRLGVPVVIGPLCGGMEFPPAFRHLDSWLTRRLVAAGRTFSSLANRVVPGKLEADLLLVANHLTEQALPPGYRGSVIRLFESGVDLSIWKPPITPRADDSEVRFVFSGRFVDWKGIQYLLPAFEMAARRAPNAVLELIGGGGAFAAQVSAQAAKPAIKDRFRVHGWVPRQQAAEILRDADVFIMPSLRECGGTAILEAMAMGKPVITTNWGGPADYVDSSCGILVEPSGEEDFISGLADAIVKLSASRELRQTFGESAQARVQRDFLTWDAKVDRVFDLLKQQCGSRPKIVS